MLDVPLSECGQLLRFKHDRAGTNGSWGAQPSRMTYMAHARGWVMVRHPGAMPYCVTEKEWLAMPLYVKPAAAAST